MNLTIHLQEERIDKATGRISGGISTFEDIRSLKIEYTPYSVGKYKIEIILFIGDKYNKQFITIDNVEKIVADGIMGIIRCAAHNIHGVIHGGASNTETTPKDYPRPTYEFPESYITPENIMREICHKGEEKVLWTTIYITNNTKEVTISVKTKYAIVKESDLSEVDMETKIMNPERIIDVKYADSGDFKFGKLNQPEENNPGIEYGEIWRELPEDRYRAFMAILNGVNKWRGDIDAIKHNTNISCDKIWKVELGKDEQLVNTIYDAEPDNTRYIMKLYGGLNGHGDWESYLDGLRTYIKCIKRMPDVDSVDVLEARSDLPDDLFSVVIVVRFDYKKKKKDPDEEIDYRELT